MAGSHPRGIVVVVVVVVVLAGLKVTDRVATCPLLSRNSKAQETPRLSWEEVGGQG
jgi:hypothetical protein